MKTFSKKCFLKSILLVFTFLFCAIGTVNVAATHKAWVLKHSGAQCVLQYPTVEDVSYPGLVYSENSVNAIVVCPVILSAMGGSSSEPANTSKSWLYAKEAKIYFRKGRSPYWCRAHAYDVSGNHFATKMVSSEEDGVYSIDLLEFRNGADDLSGSDWNIAFGVVPEYAIKLDLECALGSGSAESPAELLGYEVSICQRSRYCSTVSGYRTGRMATVQGSGIECVPSSEAAAQFLWRTVNGMSNYSDETWSIHCPVVQAVDDSYEHSRQVSLVRLYYTGASPICYLESINKRGEITTSPQLQREDYVPQSMILSGRQNVGREIGISIQCDLPPYSTVEGYIVFMTTTAISGGI